MVTVAYPQPLRDPDIAHGSLPAQSMSDYNFRKRQLHSLSQIARYLT